jgi:hypothetical protein
MGSMSRRNLSEWDKQNGESEKAFEAFVTYRDAGAARSLALAGRTLGKSTVMMEVWSSRWHWVARVAAFDAELGRRNAVAAMKASEDMIERHARMAVLFSNKVLERMQTLVLADLSAADLARWFDLAVRVERLSRGAPTERVEQTVKHEPGEVDEKERPALPSDEYLARVAAEVGELDAIFEAAQRKAADALAAAAAKAAK